jgi:hypothetical protein
LDEALRYFLYGATADYGEEFCETAGRNSPHSRVLEPTSSGRQVYIVVILIYRRRSGRFEKNIYPANRTPAAAIKLVTLTIGFFIESFLDENLRTVTGGSTAG